MEMYGVATLGVVGDVVPVCALELPSTRVDRELRDGVERMILEFLRVVLHAQTFSRVELVHAAPRRKQFAAIGVDLLIQVVRRRRSGDVVEEAAGRLIYAQGDAPGRGLAEGLRYLDEIAPQ